MNWFAAGAAALLAALVILKRTHARALTAPLKPSSAPDPAARTEPARRTPPPDARPLKSCPVCHAEYAPERRFCVRDGAPLHEGAAAGPFSSGMICPTCRRGYPSDASFCPEDSDELVPYGLFGAGSATRPPVRLDGHKICPECGIRHASGHLFCGQDGSELVVVN
jgi:hypothetical protein